MLNVPESKLANKIYMQCKPLVFKNVDLDINGDQLLFDISCRIETTGRTVLIGANGVGKACF